MKGLNSLMKRVGVGVALAALPLLGVAQNTARVQVAHNSPESQLSTADVYIIYNGVVTTTLQDVDFRTATPFTTYGIGPLPSANFVVGLAPGNSASVNDTIASLPLTLVANETAVVIAAGDLSSGMVLSKMTNARETSTNFGELQVATYHGVNDAPAVDVLSLTGPIITGSITGGNFSFGQFGSAGYVGLATDAFVGVGVGGVVLARYFVPAASLVGDAGLVVASGYLNGTPEFGVYYVPASGGSFVKLSGAVLAQLVHNSPDPDLAVVDVYEMDGGTRILDNFAFRQATPYVNLVADVGIGFAPSNSVDVNDVFITVTAPSDNTEVYNLMVVGVLDPSAYASNPNSLATDLAVIEMPGASLGSTPGNVSVRVAHGAMDVPSVDINSYSGLLTANRRYKDHGDFTVPAANHLLMVQAFGIPKPPIVSDATSSANIIGLTAPLASASAQSAFVFASGFANPAANQNGPQLGFFAAFGDGSVSQLPPGGLMQFIHNSPDPDLDTVDVYYDGHLVLDNLSFRRASPYLWMTSVITTNIDIATNYNSTSVNDADVNLTQTFSPGVPVVDIASGVAVPANWAPNPNGADISVDLYAIAPTRIRPLSTDSVEFRVFHGVTDAPNIDIEEAFTWNATLVTNLGYAQATNYLANPTGTYTINLYPTGTTNLFRRYSNMSGGTPLPNVAALLFASGFANPAANNNGPAFGLFGALANGIVLPLTDATPQSINDAFASSVEFFNAYPNPASSLLNVEVSLRTAAPVTLTLTDAQGRIAQRAELGSQPAGTTLLPVDVSSLAPGLYAYTLTVGEGQASGKLLIQR
jgi:hypothetical protein